MEQVKGSKKELEGGDGVFFDAIAERYDLLNRILSLGLDHRWRRRTVEALQLKEGSRILDLATGTADLAIAAAKTRDDISVTGVDPSVEMLAIGRQKVNEEGITDRVNLLEGDGQNLQLGDDEFDGAAVCFGIRNFPDRLQGLKEMARVTRNGAPVVILELSEPRKGPMAAMSRLYVRQIVPRVGSLLSGQKEYRYLQESIAAFPPAEDFLALMVEAGLKDVSVEPLTFGVVNLFVGYSDTPNS